MLPLKGLSVGCSWAGWLNQWMSTKKTRTLQCGDWRSGMAFVSELIVAFRGVGASEKRCEDTA